LASVDNPAPAAATKAAPFSQDGAQSHADPSIDGLHHARAGVFEIAIPAPEFPVQFGYLGFHAPPAGALDTRFDGFAQFAQAFGADLLHHASPFVAFEPKAEDVK